MKKLKFIVSTVLVVVLVLLPLFALYFRQDIRDWYVLRDYQPSERVVRLADDTAMTDYGRKLWYVHKPELLDKGGFAQNCEVGEKTIVLGCYIAGRQIFVFDVKDERLAGIHEVTAAHEMLHAGYDRLDASERATIESQLLAVFNSLENPRLQDTIKSYREKDPEVVSNELHSILGTEIKTLTPELENYYARYFTDRHRVVEIAERYEAEFSSRQNKVLLLEAELEQLKAQIDTEKVTLSSQEGVLNASKSQLDALLQANRIEEYNAQVSSFNLKVNAYNTSIARISALIDDFNKKVEEHNAIAEDQKSLIDAIDSRPTVPQAL